LQELDDEDDRQLELELLEETSIAEEELLELDDRQLLLELLLHDELLDELELTQLELLL
jgi:hypothetical protein